MPIFTYKALNADGQNLNGELESSNRVSALQELASRGTFVTQIAEKRERVFSFFQRSDQPEKIHVRPKHIAVLTRQLATSLEAGLPLMTALEVIGKELDHRPSRELLKRLGDRVQQGDSLSDALAEYPKIFSPMYTRLVRVGESGGVLDAVLSQLADMLDRQIELRERIKTASIYPCILLLVGIVSVVIIVSVIVPRIVSSLGTETFLLPWPTRVLMGLSDFLRNFWWLVLVLLGGFVVGWRQMVLRGPGRPWWDMVKLRIPILGRLITQIEASRFSRSLGILVHTGVTITEALAVTKDTVQNVVIRNAVQLLAKSIQAGESIATPLGRCNLFPPLMVQMVRVGESTGRLDEMLLRSAKIHESEAKVTLDRFVNVLPVLMILVLAVLIGFIVSGLVLAIVEFQTTGIGG
ncbi:MAG: type II secretion system F family protein [Phycisphaerae bacterium]